MEKENQYGIWNDPAGIDLLSKSPCRCTTDADCVQKKSEVLDTTSGNVFAKDDIVFVAEVLDDIDVLRHEDAVIFSRVCNHQVKNFQWADKYFVVEGEMIGLDIKPITNVHIK